METGEADSIDPIPRPQTEIKQRYAQLIARVALRTLHEIFLATPTATVEAVVFNGRLNTTDLATGKQVRPHLVSVEAERSDFSEIVLAKVEAVEPFIAFDLKRFRFTDDLDVVSGLDSRPNLMKLTPTEFEHLIKQLFIAMGAEAWTTVPSKDGGVDAVATSKNMFFGGVCLIQAQRWSKLVGLEAVHALTRRHGGPQRHHRRARHSVLVRSRQRAVRPAQSHHPHQRGRTQASLRTTPKPAALVPDRSPRSRMPR